MTAMTSTLDRTLFSRPIWLVGLIAGLAASVATEVYGLIIRGLGVPMKAGSFGADKADAINVGMFAFGVLMCTFWGTVLALLLARFASQPARIFVFVTIPLTALSLVSPLGAGATATSTKLSLCVAHLLAAAIVIPTIARRLAQK